MTKTNQHDLRVSVVLPIINDAHFLAATIDSILKQSFSDFELLILDDHSNEERNQYLKQEIDPRIRLISIENHDLATALNTGFHHAKGKYWTWIPSNNLVAPNWLSALVDALDQAPNDVDYVFAAYGVMNNDEKLLHINDAIRFDLPSLLFYPQRNLSFLYRASLAKKVGPYDSSLLNDADLDMWVRMAEQTRAIALDSVCYFSREPKTTPTARSEEIKDHTRKIIDKFLNKNNGLFDIAALFPSIATSKNPLSQRWLSRIYLASLACQTPFYCPTDAIIDQLQKALAEKHHIGLISNIIHFYATDNRWDEAAEVLADHLKTNSDDALLIQLNAIVKTQSLADLRKIPFQNITEEILTANIEPQYGTDLLFKNLSMPESNQNQAINALESFVIELINSLEDQADHPEIWQIISELSTKQHQKYLADLKQYLNALILIPQSDLVLLLMKILEAVVCAYTDELHLAKSKLYILNIQSPNLPIILGALSYLEHDANLITEPSAN